METALAIKRRSVGLVLFGTMLLVISLPAWAQAPGDGAADTGMSFDEQLALARELNATDHWRSGRSILDQLEAGLASASSQQRNRYDLTLALNLGLSGASAAGLELIEQVLTRDPEPTQQVDALALAANLASAERSYRRAFGYVRDGLLLLPEIADPAARANLLGVAGLLHAQAGQTESGLEMVREAIEHARQASSLGLESSICVATQRLAEGLSIANQRDATIEAAMAALEQCIAEGNSHFAAALEGLLGQLHLDNGQLDLAGAWLNRAAERQRTIGHLAGQMLTRLRRLELALLGNDSAPDAESIAELVNHFGDRRIWDRKAEVHRIAARFAERDGNYAEAVDHLRRQAVARERLDAWESARRQAYLAIRFDINSQRKELALLQEQARARDLEETTAQQQASLRRILQAGSALVIALLALLFLRATRQRRHYLALSRQDGLTDLLNHTCFFQTADRALNDCLANQRDFILAVGDIDHFKRINDAHGHLNGDLVLQRVAGRMREHFPDPAILGRVGGEEFALALPGEQLGNASRRVDGLREAINVSRSNDRSVEATMSFGIARFNGSETIEQLRRRADQALYRAKAEGRNRTVVSDEN